MTVTAFPLAEKNSMDKQKALEAALGQIERNFGKGSIMRLGQRRLRRRQPRRSRPARSASTSRSASAACPRGRIIEIYGPESSRQDHADPARRSPRRRSAAASAPSSTPSTRSTRATPSKLGVNIDELLISQPDTGEQALEIAEMLVRSGAIDVVVIDSVAALVPQGRDRRRDGRQPTSACRPA